MAGLVPAIHVFTSVKQDVDARHTTGHDGLGKPLMHDIRFIRENPAAFDHALNRRNLSDEDKQRYSSQHILSIDERRRAIIRVLESWQARRNAASKQIGEAKKNEDEAQVGKLMVEVAE